MNDRMNRWQIYELLKRGMAPTNSETKKLKHAHPVELAEGIVEFLLAGRCSECRTGKQSDL